MLWGSLAATNVRASEQPLFWSINRDGAPVGHLLGTIHSEDPRVLEFSDPFLRTLRESRIFAMELVPNLPNLAALAERMKLPPDTTLEALAGPARFKAVADVLNNYGVPTGQARAMRPWAAMMTISVPPPVTGLFMDFSLSLRASGSGAQVIGLESLDEQLAFLEQMELDQQLQLLDYAIEQADRVGPLHDRMVGAYLTNDLHSLYELAMEQLNGLSPAVRELFIDQGIEARNRRMLARILPELEQGGLFIAVGALHLPGDSGLLALLRQRGFVLEPAVWPFSASP